MTGHQTSLPLTITKYFWGDDLSQLNWPQHQHYITQTLLERGDQAAIRWLFQRVDKHQLHTQLPEYQLSPKSANFWKIYLS